MGFTLVPNSPQQPQPDPTPASTNNRAAQLAQLQAAIDRAALTPLPESDLPFGYRIGLLATIVGLFTLPLIYLAAIGYAALRWFNYSTRIADGVPGLFGPLLIFIPLAVALLMLLFLIKPFFAPRIKHDPNLTELDPHAEPDFFNFLEKLCAIMDTPVPRRVITTCEPNAAAGLRPGLKGLFSQEIQLVIGLPLVAGMTAAQFAGVLAHELGHGTQFGAMRLSTWIDRTNLWFARLVYQRDAWDQRIAQWVESKSMPFVLSLPMLLAQLGTWCSRRVFYLFMMASHAMSCFILRRMEFDADRWSTTLIGDAEAQQQMRRVFLITGAWSGVLADLGQAMRDRRLCDDLPRMVMLELNRRSDEVLDHLIRSHQSANTRLFDSHPNLGDRLLHMRRAPSPGLLHADVPAHCLFRTFARTCQHATTQFYELQLGDDFKNVKLITPDRLLRRTEALEKAAHATTRFFGMPLDRARLIAVSDPLLGRAPPDSADLIAKLKKLRTEMHDAAPNIAQLTEEWSLVTIRTAMARVARVELNARATVDFGDSPAPRNVQQADDMMRQSRQRADQIDEILCRRDTVVDARLDAVRQLLHDNRRAKDPKHAHALNVFKERFDTMLPVAAATGALADHYRILQRAPLCLMHLVQTIRVAWHEDRIADEIHTHLANIRDALTHVRRALADIPDPFAAKRRGATLDHRLTVDVPDPHDLTRHLQAAYEAADEIADLHHRSLGQLCFITAHVERLVGIKQPDLDIPETPLPASWADAFAENASSALASNPGMVDVNWRTFLAHRPTTPTLLALAALTSIALAIAVHWASIALLVIPIAIARRYFKWYRSIAKSGATLPAVVVSTRPGIIAALSDIRADSGSDSVYAVNIHQTVLPRTNGQPPAPGTRLATVAFYGRSEDTSPTWDNFTPIVVTTLNDDPHEHQRILDRINDEQWKMLARELARLPQPPAPGLHRIEGEPPDPDPRASAN